MESIINKLKSKEVKISKYQWLSLRKLLLKISTWKNINRLKSWKARERAGSGRRKEKYRTLKKKLEEKLLHSPSNKELVDYKNPRFLEEINRLEDDIARLQSSIEVGLMQAIKLNI